MIQRGDISKLIDRAAVGRRVRACRMARGWSLGELARRCGVDDAVICLMELGKRRGSILAVAAIALALNKPLEWILSGERTLNVAWKRRSHNQAA